MAEKKEHTIVEVESEAKQTAKKATAARKKVTEDGKTVVEVTASGNATPYRIGAILLWVVAIACEFLAILTYFGKINITFIPTIAWLIGLIVLDVVCVIIAAQLWKKSNKIDPASKANKVKFWLWNNLGLILCIVALVPVIAYDWNPISKEEKDAALAAVQGEVYWTQFGKVYHTHEDCGSLNNSDSLYHGSVDAAIEAGRTRICSFCAKKDKIDTTNLLTDGNEDEAK